MIVVKLMTAEPSVKYENATRFYVEQNGNLTVKTNTEVIAVHAAGTWASVVVEGNTTSADKASASLLNQVVYDASGDNYVNGVTNFTAENVYLALNSVQFEGKKENLTIQMDVSLYNRLDNKNLIDYRNAGREFKKMKVEISPFISDLLSGVIESKITNCSNGKVVFLRTREF